MERLSPSQLWIAQLHWTHLDTFGHMMLLQEETEPPQSWQCVSLSSRCWVSSCPTCWAELRNSLSSFPTGRRRRHMAFPSSSPSPDTLNASMSMHQSPNSPGWVKRRFREVCSLCVLRKHKHPEYMEYTAWALFLIRPGVFSASPSTCIKLLASSHGAP